MSLETTLTLAIAAGIVLTVLVVRLVLLVLFRLLRLAFRLTRRYVFGHHPAPAIAAERASREAPRPRRRLVRRGLASIGRGMRAPYRGTGRALVWIAAWGAAIARRKVDELAAILSGERLEDSRAVDLGKRRAQVVHPVIEPHPREEPLAGIR